MTDHATVIAEARAIPDDADGFGIVQKDLVDRLADALEALTQPPTDDEREALREWMHARQEFEYGECDHGTYSGGPLHGQPYAMCERWAAAAIAAGIRRQPPVSNDPIPRYAQLDVWMALYGTERSEEYERFREEHGFAETWAHLCSEVRAASGRQLPTVTRERLVSIVSSLGPIDAAEAILVLWNGTASHNVGTPSLDGVGTPG